MKRTSIALVGVVCLLASGAASAQETSSASPIGGDPIALALQPDDLPVAFSTSESDDREAGHEAIFYQPQMPAEGGLWSVMTRVELAADEAEAVARFDENQAAAAIGSSIPGSGEQRMLNSVRLTADDVGADEGLLFRVESDVQGVRVIEYRYRLRLANAVANLVVSCRALGVDQEPPALRQEAREIAARQIARLEAARP